MAPIKPVIKSQYLEDLCQEILYDLMRCIYSPPVLHDRGFKKLHLHVKLN